MKQDTKNNVDKLYSKHEIDDFVDMLSFIAENSEQLAYLSEEQRVSILKYSGLISRPNKDEIRKRKKDVKKIKRQASLLDERKARAKTGIRSARKTKIFIAPNRVDLENIGNEDATLNSERNCYVCKARYTKLHHFYDTMCASCGDLNYAKRHQTTDLTGQVALITGSRLKIGYHATLMMLRSGATVIATTRFPVDSGLRFAKEKDFKEWKNRLHIHGLDLRHTPSVEIFANYIEQTYDRLDILINNAAQTVRRPAAFYTHMIDNEKKSLLELPKQIQSILKNHEEFKKELGHFCQNDLSKESALPVAWHGTGPGIGLRASAELSQIPYSFDNSLVAKEVFPSGELDVDLQQVDLRKTNSWRLNLGEIETPEMVEVQLVNAIAPFVLCNRLAPMMKRDYTGKKHMINVTAMEGKFHRFKKASRHPHTNMAKAALNMLTHTSASELAKDGIFMNAVDTGWVTDEDPIELAKKKEDLHDFQPPLDIVDGAARVCDPFIDGINSGKHWSGKFLKDYFPIDW